jgi:putative redox protein
MEKQIYFYNSDGEKLAGTLHYPEGLSKKGVILGHCFTCSRHTRILIETCRELAKAGFLALRFDFSGNGQSEGDFIESGYSKHIGEMKTAMKFLAENGVSWIGLAGHSMGAAIAVLTCAEMQEVKAVCAMSGRLSGLNLRVFFTKSQIEELEQTGKISFVSRGRSLVISKKFIADANRYDIPKQIEALRSPLLIVHGEKDEIIPLKEAHKASKIKPSGITLAVISGADHMLGEEAHRRNAAVRMTEWFAEMSEADLPVKD